MTGRKNGLIREEHTHGCLRCFFFVGRVCSGWKAMFCAIYILIAVYSMNFFSDIGIFCSSDLGSLLLLLVTGHTGGPCEHWVQVRALAKVRGTYSGGSKSRKLVTNHGIAFRPARANQAHANPKNNAQLPPHVIFYFPRSPHT